MKISRVSVTGYIKVPLLEGLGLESVPLTPFHISVPSVPKLIRRQKGSSCFFLIPGWEGRFAAIKRLREKRFVSHAEGKPSSKVKDVVPLPQHVVTLSDGSQRLVTDTIESLGSFRVWVDGCLVSVSKPKGDKKVVVKPSIRGTVLGFSSGARRRLMRKIATFKRDARPLFVTLTYPGVYSVDYAQWKIHLDLFSQRFHRKFATGSFVWRLEPQRRGAPHYHLLVYGVEFSADNGAWFRSAWAATVNSGDPLHETWGADVQQLRSERGVRSYVGKYIAKRQAVVLSVPEAEDRFVDWTKVGRWWGIRYSDNLPVSDVIGATGISYAESCSLLRVLRRYGEKTGKRGSISGSLPGLTIFVNNGRRWLDCISGIIGSFYSPLGYGGRIFSPNWRAMT